MRCCSSISLILSALHYSGIPNRLRIVEERHESEIHVQLLVTMEERQLRIVSDEVKFV